MILLPDTVYSVTQSIQQVGWSRTGRLWGFTWVTAPSRFSTVSETSTWPCEALFPLREKERWWLSGWTARKRSPTMRFLKSAQSSKMNKNRRKPSRLCPHFHQEPPRRPSQSTQTSITITTSQTVSRISRIRLCWMAKSQISSVRRSKWVWTTKTFSRFLGNQSRILGKTRTYLCMEINEK